MFLCLIIACVGLVPLLELTATLGVAAGVSEANGVARAGTTDLIKYLDLALRVISLIIAWLTRPAKDGG
jgi:hypothetical protein